MTTNRSAFGKWWANAHVTQALSGAERWRVGNIKRLCKRAFEKGRSVGCESAKAQIEKLERQKLDDDVYIIGMDFRINDLKYEIEQLREALSVIKWRSSDKDNMEFAARITYAQMDKIRKALEGGE